MSSNSFLRFDNLPTPIFIEPQNDNEWNTVLQWVLNNRSQCARFVLDGNVVPKNASSIGPKGGKTTILHKVIKSKTICPNLRLNLVQTIISSDSRSASVVDSQVSLPLHVAVRNEAKVDTITRDQILSILIQTYSAALLITDLVGCTPLHITCEELPGSEADVKKLIRAAPNAARIWNSSGVLPIHIACSKSCPEDVLELLLAAYPDSIDVNSISGGAPLGILRDSGGSEAAINVLKRRLRGYKAELGEDVVEIDDDDVVEVVKEEPKKRKRQKNIVKQPQKLVIVDSDDEDEVQVLKTENTKNSSDMNQRNDKPNEDFNNNLQYQALAQYQTNLGLNQNFYANQRPFLLGAYQSALPQRVPFQNSSSGSSILEDIKLRHQVEINQVKQSHAMVLNDIRRHLNRKTSNLDQSKSNVNKLKKELEDLKALYNEKTQERAALLKRKNEREEEETALRNELNSLKAQAEQNNKAHEALLQQLTSKFQQEIQAQKRRMELELEALNATQSKEISDVQLQSSQEKAKVEKLQEEQLNQKKATLAELQALYTKRKEEYEKISNNNLDGADINRMEKERRAFLHVQLMNEARRVLDPLRSTLKELEHRLLVTVMERQRRRDRMANGKKTLSVFCKSFMDHEPTAKVISLLKCNIAELEQVVDDLRKKVKDRASGVCGNGDVDVVNVVLDEDVRSVRAVVEEGEDTVDGITIYPRSEEESQSTMGESLPE